MPKRTYVRIEGLDQLVRDLDKTGAIMYRASIDGVQKASELVEGDMVRRAKALPFAEGELSINTNIIDTYKDDGQVSAMIGPGAKVEHAFFAEVGTRGNTKKPSKQYARPAVDKNKKKIREIFEASVVEAFERVIRRGI